MDILWESYGNVEGILSISCENPARSLWESYASTMGIRLRKYCDKRGGGRAAGAAEDHWTRQQMVALLSESYRSSFIINLFLL